MPELTEVLPNKPAEEAAEKNDSNTESGSDDDSIPELEETEAGAGGRDDVAATLGQHI